MHGHWECIEVSGAIVESYSAMKLTEQESDLDRYLKSSSQEINAEQYVLAAVYRYVLDCHARRESGRKNSLDNPDVTQADQTERHV